LTFSSYKNLIIISIYGDCYITMPPLLVLISRLYVSTTMPKRCCKVIKKRENDRILVKEMQEIIFRRFISIAKVQ
jgi:hypothetical protein